MSQAVHDIVVVQYSRAVRNLKSMLLKAREFSKERGFDENSFLSLKAAPDMFPLSRQVQLVSDMTKGGAARLGGKTPPAFEDNETTLEQLIQRLDKTAAFINEMKPADFSGWEKIKYTSPFRPGQYLNGKDFFEQHSIPNVYFHMTATYMLLRTHGVNLGKKDYLGEVNWMKEQTET